MASLKLLANEILDIILAYLSVSDLASLSLVCKRLNEQSTPFLYRSIVLTWDAHNTIASTRPLQLLLRTLIEAPSLEKHVLKLDLRSNGYREYSHKAALSKLEVDVDTTVAQSSCKAILSLDPPEPETWKTGLEAGSIHAMVALLLTLTRSLRRLDMSFDLIAGSSFLSTLTTQSLRGELLPQLEHIALGTDVCKDGDDFHYRMSVDIRQFHPFLCLPRLKSANLQLPNNRELPERTNPQIVDHWKGVTFWTWITDNALRLKNLTILRLQYTRASPLMLKQILSATPSLELLEYDYWCSDSFATLNRRVLGEAILQVRNTLRHLTVALTPCKTDMSGELEYFGDRWVEGSLETVTRTFQKLESLEIAPVVLLGYSLDDALDLSEVLPSSLRCFCLRDDLLDYSEWEWTEQETANLVSRYLTGEGWKLVTPRLTEVNLHLCESSECEQWNRDACKRFSDIVEAQGLVCHIARDHLDCQREHEHVWEQGYID